MAKFTLEIRCDNAAFEDDPLAEVRRILVELVDGLHGPNVSDNLRDNNGNTVGKYRFTYDD